MAPVTKHMTVTYMSQDQSSEIQGAQVYALCPSKDIFLQVQTHICGYFVGEGLTKE